MPAIDAYRHANKITLGKYIESKNSKMKEIYQKTLNS